MKFDFSFKQSYVLRLADTNQKYIRLKILVCRPLDTKFNSTPISTFGDEIPGQISPSHCAFHLFNLFKALSIAIAFSFCKSSVLLVTSLYGPTTHVVSPENTCSVRVSVFTCSHIEYCVCNTSLLPQDQQ
jgi:hypothetical protein